MVAFHDCTRIELVSGSMEEYGASSGNTASAGAGIGTGCTGAPEGTIEYGSANGMTEFSATRLLNGGTFAAGCWYAPPGKSYVSAYDGRRAVPPAPVTSHAAPTRGERLSHCLFVPVLPGGNPSAPGYRSPAGAFTKLVLRTPAR